MAGRQRFHVQVTASGSGSVKRESRSGERSLDRLGDAADRAGRDFERSGKAIDFFRASALNMRKSARGADRELSVLDRSIMRVNRNTTFLARSIRLLKWPALIAGAGLAAQALGSLGAAATGLVGALAPLAGLLTAYPTLLGAVGQAAGVVALSGINDLTEAMGGSEEAMKRLTPQAQRFMGQLERFKPQFEALRRSVQGPLFAGLNTGLRQAARNFPVLRRVMETTAQTMGMLAERAGRMIGGRGFGRDLERIGNTNARALGRMGKAGLNLGDALRHVMVVARPLTNWLSRGAVQLSRWVVGQARAGRESGRMAKFFSQTQHVTGRLLGIVRDLGAGLYGIGRAAAPLGRSMLKVFADASSEFRRWTSSVAGQNAMAEYFRRAKAPLWEFGRLIRDAGGSLLRLGQTPGLANLIRQVRTELLPVFESTISTTTRAFGPHLVAMLTQVTKLIGTLAGSSGPLTVWADAIAFGAKALNTLLSDVPGLKGLVVHLMGLAAVLKTMQFVGAITGVKTLIGLFTTLRTAAVGATTATAAAGGASATTGLFGTAAGVAGGGAAAGAGGIAGGLMAKLKAVRWARVGAIGVGLQLGTAIFEGVQLGADKGGADLMKSLEARTKASAFGQPLPLEVKSGLLTDLTGWDPFGSGKAEKAKELQSLLEEIQDTTSGISGEQRRQIEQLARQVGLTREQSSALRGMLDQKQLQGSASRARAVLTGIFDPKHIAGDVTKWSAKLREAAGFTTKTAKQIEAAFRQGPQRGITFMSQAFDRGVANIRRSMRAGTISTQQGMAAIESLLRSKLEALGVSGAGIDKAVSMAKPGGIDTKRKPGEPGPGFQRGGWLTNRAVAAFAAGAMLVPGAGSGDKVPALLEPGEVVWNKKAVAKMGGPEAVNRANHDFPRFATGGQVKKNPRERGVARVQHLDRVGGGDDRTAMPRWAGNHAAGWVAAAALNTAAIAAEERLAAAGRKAKKRKATGGALGGEGGPILDQVTGMSSKFGLRVSSGYRPGDDGWHGVDRARDYSNGVATPEELAFAQAVATRFGSNLLELIHTPLGWAIKNGQRVPPYAAEDHYDHVHVAAQFGGIIQRLARGGIAGEFARAVRDTRANKLATLALFMAGKHESGFRDLAGGHSSSEGVLQLLASTAQGMGISAHDEYAIAHAFLTRGYWGKGSAISLSRKMDDPAAIAHLVQGNATGTGVYARERGWAEAMIRSLGLLFGPDGQLIGPWEMLEQRQGGPFKRMGDAIGYLTKRGVAKDEAQRTARKWVKIHGLKGKPTKGAGSGASPVDQTIAALTALADAYAEYASRAFELEAPVFGAHQPYWLQQELGVVFKLRNKVAAARFSTETQIAAIDKQLAAAASSTATKPGKEGKAAQKKKGKKAKGGKQEPQKVDVKGLRTERNKLAERLTTLTETLSELQGIGPLGVLPSLPAVGELGGRIFDIQSSLLGSGNSAETAADTGVADLLRAQLDEANVRNLILQRQYPVLSQIPQLIGAFAGGREGGRGGWALVGEEGPELAKLANGGAVYTGRETEAFAELVGSATAAGGGTANPGGSDVRVTLEDNRTRVVVDGEIVREIFHEEQRAASSRARRR